MIWKVQGQLSEPKNDREKAHRADFHTAHSFSKSWCSMTGRDSRLILG